MTSPFYYSGGSNIMPFPGFAAVSYPAPQPVRPRPSPAVAMQRAFEFYENSCAAFGMSNRDARDLSEMSGMLQRLSEMGEEVEQTPIVALCLVADRNKTPFGFSAITRAFDDHSDADLWKESMWSVFTRPVRYIAVSRQIPKGSTANSIEVLIDIAVVSDKDPVPPGFTALDFTADSREKGLKKKYLCIKTAARSGVVDAIGDVIILAKQKRPPMGYTIAGDIDGMIICYKHVVIPQSWGAAPLTHSTSNPATLYPGLNGAAVNESAGPDMRHSTSDISQVQTQLDSFTIRQKPGEQGVGRSIDGVPFTLSASVKGCLAFQQGQRLPALEEPNVSAPQFVYNFAVERANI
uniref:MABP domain-containing protein n=1 Tax=Steinernema glaseri TaxID=37863 RepID=A0A1I8A9W0_9BILA